MTGERAGDGLDDLLAEQRAYYRARARAWAPSQPMPGGDEAAQRLISAVQEAIDRHVHGDVLELACGPGSWTGRLAARATAVTALDASSELLAVARERVPDAHVRFSEADIFGWGPERRYDAIFFGFWLSHVPRQRFAGFWARLADALAPGGRVLFVDDGYIGEDERERGVHDETIIRVLDDGSRHRIIKAAHTAPGLQSAIGALGWRVEVREVWPYYWGVASPSQ